MEKNPVELMKQQINCLPERDIKFAEKFINNRDFESLQDLVNSDVYLVEKNAKLSNPNPKYANINIENLNELKGTVDEYCNLLYPEVEVDYMEEDDYNCDYTTEEENEW